MNFVATQRTSLGLFHEKEDNICQLPREVLFKEKVRYYLRESRKSPVSASLVSPGIVGS
jgi:hypothetical protein